MTDNNSNEQKKQLREISDEELKKILEDHEKWLSSDGNDGVRADLSDTDLRNRKLKKVNLRRADLRRADFSNTDLQKAKLTKAKLQKAILKDANLRKATLQEAKLHGADLTFAILYKAKLMKTQLCWADLRGAELQKAILKGSKLQNTFLSHADLRKADLSHADLRKADLSHADLQNANLTMANIKSAKMQWANFTNAEVGGIKYSRWGRYRGVRIVNSYGSARFKRFAQDQDFIEELRSTKWGFIKYFIWLILSDCGRSLLLWAGWSILMAILFGLVFYTLGPDSFRVRDLPWSRWTMVYYSVVTYTTLGFGDITPKTPSATWWVMAEVVLGYIMLGGLISIFATKLARRS